MQCEKGSDRDKFILWNLGSGKFCLSYDLMIKELCPIICPKITLIIIVLLLNSVKIIFS